MNDLDELAELTMRKVACPGPHETYLGETVCQLTDADDYKGEKCMGSGTVLDPGLANLREVLWVECDGKLLLGPNHYRVCVHGYSIPHDPVKRRDMSDWPKGALAGAIEDVVAKDKDFPSRQKILVVCTGAHYDGDPDSQVVSATVSALKAKV